ncbi:MAG: virginiamycin B lyase family protein, partial [Gemmatimonadota bacterium]
YGHSIRPDRQGRTWFNGHFTKAPVRLGYVDGSTGETRFFDVPGPAPAADGAGPIPYGLRIGPDGSVWMTELHGNRLVRLDPATGEFRIWTLPTAHSGPRRPDIGPDGTVWIPEYAAGKLARFDPRTERFTEYDLPIADALPYVVRLDPDRGRVWVGTGAADAVFVFDPERERFDIIRLPTRGALIRHIDVDPATGELWAAYGASPGIPPRIARIRLPSG